MRSLITLSAVALSALMAPGLALACDPIDWESSAVWPVDGQGSVPSDVAPLVVVHDVAEFGTTYELLPGNLGERVPVSLDTVAIEGLGDIQDFGPSQLVRLVPDEPLPAGDYTVVVRPLTDHDEERAVLTTFTVVDGQGPELFVGEARDLTVGERRVGEDSCGPYDYRTASVGYTIPEAADAIETAVTVHVVPDEGAAADDEGVAWQRWQELGDPVAFTVPTDTERVCVAVRRWGIRPDYDAQSEPICWDAAEGPTDDTGAGDDTAGPIVGQPSVACSCSAVSAPAAGLWGLGLVGLALVRRRNGKIAG